MQKIKTRCLLLCGILVVAGAVVLTQVKAQSGQALSYGMTLNMPTKVQSEQNLVAIARQNLNAAAQTGAKIVRVAIPWSHIQPVKPASKTDGNWYIPEIWVREAKARGLEVLFRLDAVKYRDCNTSAVWMGWDYGCPSNGLPPAEDDPRIKQTGLPDNARAWTQFVEEMAKRFGSDVKYWQVGNEVDSEIFWAGSKEDYVDLLKITKQALYGKNPNLRLLTAGFTGGVMEWKAQEDIGTLCGGISVSDCELRESRIEFIDYVLKKGSTLPPAKGKKSPSRYGFDIADIHIYGAVYETDGLMKIWTSWLAEAANKNKLPGGTMPFWITETGGPLETAQSLGVGCDVAAKTPAYENRHFRQIIHRAVSFARFSPERVFWWSIIDYPNSENIAFSCMGLYTSDWLAKAGMFTYQFFALEADESQGFSAVPGVPANVLAFRLKVKPQFVENGNTDIIVIYSADPNLPSPKTRIIFPNTSTPKKLMTAGALLNVTVNQVGNEVTPGFTPVVFLAPADTIVQF